MARESKSGLGLTPLHTAVIYEQLDVFDYLSTKFPETLKLTDLHGWTPMDYVYSMPDKTFYDKLFNSDIIFEVCSFFVLHILFIFLYFYSRIYIFLYSERRQKMCFQTTNNIYLSE